MALVGPKCWAMNLRDMHINKGFSLYLSRSIGTFARALDCGSAVREPSLHLSAAAASRDITLVC